MDFDPKEESRSAEARRLVASQEAGEIQLDVLLAKVELDDLPTGDPLKNHEEIYFRIRLIEHVAYVLRNSPNKQQVHPYVDWALTQEQTLQKGLDEAEALVPDCELARYGKDFLVDRYNWALERLEVFQTWGY